MKEFLLLKDLFLVILFITVIKLLMEKSFCFLELLFVELVKGMVPLGLATLKVEIIYLSFARSAGFPRIRERCLQSFFGDIEEIFILLRIYP